MHPAPSVILFTTLSGMGFGLLAWLGMGYPNVTGWMAFFFYALAYALACGGLMASTFHLGHPERAVKAFRQWRSSWLSREACTSVAALLVMGLFAASAIFLNQKLPMLGCLGAILCIATVITTAMIYTQLKTVPRWNTPLTPLLFVSLSLTGGALLAGQTTASLWLLALSGALLLISWLVGDSALQTSGSSLATATGLGEKGSVRAFEPPHTGSNYLLKEFAFHVGRKHARNLRILSFFLAILLPFFLLLIFSSAGGVASHITAILAAISHFVGAAASRWLFFAQAEHVVGLYYGRRETA